jgi:4-aminobutyrate aminotransferase-like enzyme
MIGVELVKDEKLTPATTEAMRDALLANGVLVGVGGIHGNVIRFQPPRSSPASRSIKPSTHSRRHYRK